jgi:hypothetical protein
MALLEIFSAKLRNIHEDMARWSNDLPQGEVEFAVMGAAHREKGSDFELVLNKTVSAELIAESERKGSSRYDVPARARHD